MQFACGVPGEHESTVRLYEHFGDVVCVLVVVLAADHSVRHKFVDHMIEACAFLAPQVCHVEKLVYSSVVSLHDGDGDELGCSWQSGAQTNFQINSSH